VGYYFAREVHEKTGVPIGIIDSNWGGTPIEPWIAHEGLGMVDALQPALEARQAEITAYREQLSRLAGRA
jgi:sialate O-acetylesterase